MEDPRSTLPHHNSFSPQLVLYAHVPKWHKVRYILKQVVYTLRLCTGVRESECLVCR